MAETQYTINPTTAQDSIKAFLEEQYPDVPVIEDGLIDGEHDEIELYRDGSIKPFIILWHSTAYRTPRGRSIAHEKLDTHRANLDVVVVGRKGAEVRKLLNEIGDTLTGWSPENAGSLVKGNALWEQSRATLDSQNKPNRWAGTDRYSYGVQANKIT